MVDDVSTSRDQAVAFGPKRSLMGIVTSPRTPVTGDRPGVLLLNSGLIHRVGAHRLHVSLARALAKHGFTTLRFDLSGIGDSDRREEPLSLSDMVANDIDDALHYLRTARNIDRFLLVGLCSGAQDALTTAMRCTDVVGVSLLDIPGSFKNWQYQMYHYGRRLGRWESWRNTLSGKNDIFRRIWGVLGETHTPGSTNSTPGVRPILSKPSMREAFDRLLARHASIQLVFSSGLEGMYNHASQFREVFPSVATHPLVSCRYYSNADHVFSSLAQREDLIRWLTEWLTGTRFSHHPAAPVSREHAGHRPVRR